MHTRLKTLLLAALGGLVLLLAATPDARALDEESCLYCHGDAWLFDQYPAEIRAQVVIPEEKHLSGLHGAAGVGCANCHMDMMTESFPHPRKAKPVNCGICHSDIRKTFTNSLHGYARERGNPRAPTCTSCHGSHDMLPSSDLNSPIHKLNLPKTCGNCHGHSGLLTDEIVKLPESFQDYAQSVHGQGNQRGVSTAASCDDCHQVHNLKNAADPESPINHRNVSKTCGRCHSDKQAEYDRSIHGRAVQAGVGDSPTCTNCHGEHLILSPRGDATAKTHGSRLATETCGKCHDDPVIIRKYDLRGGVLGSYRDSYHGWATRRESSAAATCVSCHTAHEVLPAADPESTIAPGNVVETCQQCHAGATMKFARSYDHQSASISENPVNRFLKNFYVLLIAVVIGSMVLHNLVLMNYYLMERRKEEKASRWVLRFDRSQVIQHLLLSLSFIMLAVTGFALRYPEAGWVRLLQSLGMSEPVRANMHRFFALMLIGTGVSHVYYVLATRRGRAEIRAMIPSLRDVNEMKANLAYHTWRSTKKAKFGRYDYSQKAEYWALIWGTILMVFTGFVLWFPETAVRIFPVWIVSASQTIHFYEGWLATLAILIWHFFFVMFHPEEYPMSWTWLTGRMSEKAVRRHHSRWYQEEIAKDPEAVRDGDPEPEEADGDAEDAEDGEG